MIRAYESGDLEAIVTMVRNGHSMQPSDVKERLDKWTSLVWEDAGAVKGVCSYDKEGEGEVNLRVYVDPPVRHTGIGNALYEAAMPEVCALGHGRVTVGYRQDQDDAQAFFRRRGFTYWYSMDMLTYEGPKMPDPLLPPGVEIRPYDSEHYEQFLLVMAESFIPQRRFFDFRPHDVRELHADADDHEKMLANRENMFVVTDRGNIVAIAELEGNFIDTIGVDLSCRGRGFGKTLMQYCINILLDRGYSTVETSVVLGNMPAWRLYNTLGFRRVQINEWACKWI